MDEFGMHRATRMRSGRPRPAIEHCAKHLLPTHTEKVMLVQHTKWRTYELHTVNGDPNHKIRNACQNSRHLRSLRRQHWRPLPGSVPESSYGTWAAGVAHAGNTSGELTQHKLAEAPHSQSIPCCSGPLRAIEIAEATKYAQNSSTTSGPSSTCSIEPLIRISCVAPPLRSE